MAQTERDQEAQDLRIEQMPINIEELGADMRWATRKFVVQMIATIAGSAAAGAAITALILRH